MSFVDPHPALPTDSANVVHVAVQVAAVPAEPPAAFADYIEPEHDVYGAVVDWRLASRILTNTPTPTTAAAFRAWRSSFTDERVVGSRELVISFVSWVQTQFDAVGLAPLTLAHAHISALAASRMRQDVEQSRRRARADSQACVAIFDSSAGSAPLRGFLPTVAPTTIAAARGISLEVDSDALTLHVVEPAGRRCMVITGWATDVQGELVVSTPDGPLRLDAPPIVHTLRGLAPGVPEVAVQRWPLHLFFAPVVVNLADASSLAIRHGRGLSIYSGSYPRTS